MIGPVANAIQIAPPLQSPLPPVPMEGKDVSPGSDGSPPPRVMSRHPTVSVLMAVYNGDKYLRAAVQSVLEQTYRDFEFVIVDDGSSDQSLPILTDFATADPRIRLSSRPNKGLTRTLNEGLKLCKGRYVARMDSDDICLPARFEKQVAYLQANPAVTLVGSQVEFIDPDGCQINLKPGIFLTHEEIDAALLHKGWPLVHPAVMMRRDALLAVGGYAEAFQTNQDHDLFLRMAEHGRVVNLPDVLLQYRQHFQSISLVKCQQQGETVEAIVTEAYKRRGIGVPPDVMHNRPRLKSKLDYHRSWCWAALAGGHTHTARKHALATLRREPFAAETWRMMYCAIRGR